MTASKPQRPLRLIACARCGASFTCGGPDCWCAAESFRLPMPTDAAATCLCPACLRQLAQDRN